MHNLFTPTSPQGVVYWRQPTPAELRFGHGAIHYAEFDRAECLHPKTGELKRWLISPYDGLRYYRPR